MTVCEEYDEHRGERLVWRDEEENEEQWECTECGAEWWQDVVQSLNNKV